VTISWVKRHCHEHGLPLSE